MNGFSKTPIGAVAVLVTIVTVFSGCQTTSGQKDAGKLVPAPRIPFQPVMSKVPIQSGEGSYPNLFTTNSHAIWGNHASMAAMVSTPETLEAREEASPDAAAPDESNSGAMYETPASLEEAMEPVEAPATDSGEIQVALADESRPSGPLTIHCYLESQFSDMSIAYDAVGLRGIQFYLALPDGSRVLPVQKELDSELKEEPVGALKRFGRKVTLYFPSRAIMVDNPAVTPGATGVRLVLEGQGTEFYFEWRPAADTTATARPPRWDEDALRVTKSTYRKAVSTAKWISHEFD